MVILVRYTNTSETHAHTRTIDSITRLASTSMLGHTLHIYSDEMSQEYTGLQLGDTQHYTHLVGLFSGSSAVVSVSCHSDVSLREDLAREKLVGHSEDQLVSESRPQSSCFGQDTCERR